MMRTRILTIALAFLLVLAGCTGTDVPDVAPGGNGSGVGGNATDPGDFDSDEFDAAAPESLLRDAGSFTSTWTFALTDADGETTTSVNRYAIDIAANRTSESFDVTGGERVTYERFVADGVSYGRFGEGDDVLYQVFPFQGDPMTLGLARGAAFGGEDLSDAEAVGTETFDGVTVTRYEYRDPLLWQQFGATDFGGSENVTITEFTLVSLVDEDGLARSTGWTVVGETEAGEEVRAEWRFELTGVGSTTVPDPAWLAEAEAQSEATAAL
jgi:hypothetical protein